MDIASCTMPAAAHTDVENMAAAFSGGCDPNTEFAPFRATHVNACPEFANVLRPFLLIADAPDMNLALCGDSLICCRPRCWRI